MKASILTIIVLALYTSLAFATVQTDIKKANKAGKSIFLVVTERGNADNAEAMNVANEAHRLAPKSAVIELNRSDRANESLVTKYRLAGAPLPLLLVISSNGDVAGTANYKLTTAANLAAMIPSPKKSEVLKAITAGKPVFLVVSTKSHQKGKVISECEAACDDMKQNAKLIEVDFDDASEKVFLEELGIRDIGGSPQTYVINAQGRIAGSFTGVTDSKALVATATKAPGGGCCPPNSGKSCGPAKK